MHCSQRPSHGVRLRIRIGLGLVEVGLHLMVRARESALGARTTEPPFSQAFFNSSRAMTTRWTWLVPS